MNKRKRIPTQKDYIHYILSRTNKFDAKSLARVNMLTLRSIIELLDDVDNIIPREFR